MTAMADLVMTGPTGDTITYSAITGSAGDGVPALWRVNDVLKAPAIQTSLQLQSRDTQDKKGRRSIITWNAFYVNEVGGQTITSRVPMKVEVVLPLTMPADIAAAYVKTALRTASATLIENSVAVGYAPRG